MYGRFKREENFNGLRPNYLLRNSRTPPAPHSHIPYGDEGSGHYSDNTIGCYDVMHECTPLVLRAVGSNSVRTDHVFTIADYGCADGGTSMPLWYACVKELRAKYGAELQIHVMYDDQPVNDFKSLFCRLQGLLPGPSSYCLDFPNVFVTACGTSFYKQCLPSGSVKLGFSATAMHWLSSKPCDITGALHHTMITEPGEAEKFREQAERDWETILLKRAEELAPGGKLVLAQFTIDAQGQFDGNTKEKKVSMHHKMCELWRGMVNDGIITEKEFYRTTFAMYYRTAEEYRKPFESESSPVRRAGLSLISMETKIVRCPYHAKWVKDGGNSEAHARWYVPTLRTWSNSTFMSGLCGSRSIEEKSKIVDDLFRRYEVEVATNPGDHGMDYVHAFMFIEKLQ